MIPPRFQSALDFSEGLAPVEFDGKWGYIRESGEWAIPNRFLGAGAFHEQRAIVKNLRGEEGVIGTNGALIARLRFDEIRPFQEGLAAVWTGAKRLDWGGGMSTVGGGRWGFINRSGTLVIQPQFASTGDFSGGLAPAQALDGTGWGFIDSSGRFVIPPKFSKAHAFSSGVAWVQRGWDDNFALINRRGDYLTQFAFMRAGQFFDGLACVDGPSERGFIAKNGELRVTYQAWTFPAGHLCSPKETGNMFSENLAIAYSGKAAGYVGTDGQVKIPFRFNDADNFSEGLAAVQVGRFWGYVNKSGSLVIQPSFARAFAFVDGLALVSTGKTWAYINGDGKIVVDRVWQGR